MAWYLDIDGTSQTLDAWGIKSIRLDFVNKATSTLTIFPAEGAASATSIMDYGDTVKLLEDTTVKFWGTCDTSPVICLRGQKINRVYRVQDAFFDLAKHVYEQDWHEDPTNTVYRGRVQLARDVDGDKVSIGKSIKDIIEYAIDDGVELQYNSADFTALSTIAPDNEAVDLTCLEAVMTVLNWAPSVATSIDYSTTPYPTIRFVKRASASASAVNLVSDDMQTLNATPRNDLKVDGVVLSFETTDTIDNETYTTTTQQTAEDTSGINVIRQTIDLEGVSASRSEQKAEVVTTDDDTEPNLTDPTTTDFWEHWVPKLAGVDAGTLSIVSSSSSVTPAGVLTTYPRVLLSGTVPEWTDKICTTATFSAELSFTLNGRKIVGMPFEIELTVTDASTKTYSQLISSSYKPGETAPAGLAQSIYDERSTLQYQGQSVDLKTDGIDLTPKTSDVVNYTNGGNGIDGLSAINAVVESVSYEFDGRKSTRTISFGPQRRLGAQDYISLVRATRTLRESSWSRKDPIGSTGTSVNASGPAPSKSVVPLGDVLPPATASTTSRMCLMLDANGATAGREWKDPLTSVEKVSSTYPFLALCINRTTNEIKWREVEYGIR